MVIEGLKKTRIIDLYKTQRWSDCTFIIGDQKLSAHKLMLAFSSPVFEQMFFGSLASSEVEITDADPDSFRQMLEFIYTDAVEFKSVANAWDVYTIATKYFIHDLKKACLYYVERNLGVNTLLLSYEYAEFYNLKHLSASCWDKILLFAEHAIKDEYHMKDTTLKRLANLSSIDEAVRQQAILKWADHECALRDIEGSDANIALVLDDCGISTCLQPAQEVTVLRNVDLLYRMRDFYKPQAVDRTMSIVSMTDVRFSCDVVLLGIVTCPLSFDHVPFDLCLSVYEQDGSIAFKHKLNYHKAYSEDEIARVTLSNWCTLRGDTWYVFKISTWGANRSRILKYKLNYLSPQIKFKSSTHTVDFSNETHIGFLTGLAFYPH